MQTDDPGTTDHLQWLESVVPDLEELEGSLATERCGRVLALEQFALSEPLQELEKLVAEQCNEFDALDFVGQLRMGSGKPLWGDEEFQSNLLAWLLDPQGSHGTADYFLRSFLSLASTGWLTSGGSMNAAAPPLIRLPSFGRDISSSRSTGICRLTRRKPV